MDLKKIFLELDLHEMSDQSERHSIYILNILFHKKFIDKLDSQLKPMFPIDHVDIQNIKKCSELCETTSNISIFRLMKESFPAHEDYALTILNKYFTSTDKIRMKHFLIEKCKFIVTDKTIKDLYDSFHSTFN